MASHSEPLGDPAQLMSLLWRHQQPAPLRRRGPRPTRSIEDVIRAASRLADESGLESLSMRLVAEAVGVSTMSLYTYVPSRADLVALMVDAAYAEMARPILIDLPWQQRLQVVADLNLAVVHTHPWLVAVTAARPPLGPGVMAKYEHELSAFDGLGLDDVAADDCLTMLLTFVQGTARASVAADADKQTSGISDEQWWEANAPLLAKVFDPEAFPRATRIGAAAGAANGSAYDPARAYNFGLQRILAGITTLITSSDTATLNRNPVQAGAPSADRPALNPCRE